MVDEVEGMGVLQPVIDAEARRGNRATVTVGSNLIRGNPPAARLHGHLDRRRVEDQLDLGTLMRWIPPTSRGGSWTLVDTATGSSLTGAGWTPFGAVAARFERRASTRARVGWVEDDPRLARPAAAEWAVRTCRVSTSSAAVEVHARISELQVVAGAAATAADLPDWFVRRCSPERDNATWLERGREIGRLSPAEQRSALWDARWTAAEWLRTRARGERTWELTGADVVDEHELDITLAVPVSWAPIDSAKWMLRAAGVVDRVTT